MVNYDSTHDAPVEGIFPIPVHRASIWCALKKLHQDGAVLIRRKNHSFSGSDDFSVNWRTLIAVIGNPESFSAGIVSAMIRVSFVAPTRQGVGNPLFHLGDTNGNDSRRSLEDGRRKRSQIR